PEDLTPQVVAVARTAAGIVLLKSRTAIQRRKAMILEPLVRLVKWRRIIASRQVQQPVASKSNGTAGMAADITLRIKLEDDFFAASVQRIVSIHKARQAVYGGIGRTVKGVYVVVFCKVWI